MSPRSSKNQHSSTSSSTSTSSWDMMGSDNKMDIVYFSNEFPKDDLVHLYRRLHHHSKDKRRTHLFQFLDEATKVIKDEIKLLPNELKQHIPPFETVLSWAEDSELREGLLCGAVDGVLLIVVQIASVIGYLEDHVTELKNFENTSLAGLGIGLLASTAVSLSSSLVDLPLAGADAVRLAFRMGIHVQGVSENLETRDLEESPDTWAYVVHNVDPTAAQAELESMHAEEGTPATGKIFISAVSRTSVTVSGPPTRLKSLFNKSEFFRETRFIPLPVYGGLCHAPHVYNVNDAQSIICSERLNTCMSSARPLMAIHSTSSGVPYPAQNAHQLYEAVIMELLTQAICFDNVVEGAIGRLNQTTASEVMIYCFGNSLPLSDLQKAIKENASQVKPSTTDFMAWVNKESPSAGASRGPAQSKLAIVGMSCRLPGGATDADKFWEVLEQGLDVSREIPIDRFDISTHYDPTGKDMNKSQTKYMCAIDEPGLFDAPFFNMSPRESQITDPQMRLALVTAYEALEQSGYVGGRTASTQAERIGTYYGQAADDYREVNQGQEVSTYYIPGGCRAFGPGRINYFFKFSGPSYSIDTACSSGLAAVEVACQALWSGQVDTVITGGLNVLTNPDGFAGLNSGHFLTKGHNACKTWDASADGYCRADGIVSFVIKRLEDAQADNDRVLATILGAGTNHSANAVSITHPHAGHQAHLARQVLRRADVNPLDVSYIELHGTGTQAGDHEEIQGITEVYAPITKRRSKDKPLHIGAVKSNVGHGESVAGATSLFKTVLMMQKNSIPRHIGIKTEINPRLPKDFDKRNMHIPFEQTPWLPALDRKRLAVVNSFGAAGGNTTMILEDGPKKMITEKDPRPSHAIVVSAKTKGSLSSNIERMIAYLDKHPDTDLASLSYTTTARRYQHTHRVAIVTSDIEHLKKQLQSRLDKVDSIKAVGKSGPPPVAFTFTGQGASHKSMNLQLYHDAPVFREQINILDSLAQAQGFPSFIPALDGSFEQDHQHSPVITQLALVCTEIALAKYWASLGVAPDVVIGHSLGEYAALHIAGVTSANDTIFMVGLRAKMLQERCQIGSHTMMAVRASQEQIAEKSEGKPYTIACANGPSDTVLSGTKDEMDDIAKPMEAAGFRTIKLDVAFAFHSAQTDPILDDFEAAVKSGVLFHEPKMPVISPLLGKVVFDDKALNANYFRRATRETVDFLSALQQAQKVATIGDDTVWIEMGPHPVCNGFIKSTIPSMALAVPSLRRGDDNWKTMADSMAALHLAGVYVNWNEFHGPFEQRSLEVLDLPLYAWNDKNYWLPYTGDWCLTKGNTFYDNKKEVASGTGAPAVQRVSDLQTSTVHQVIEESIEGAGGRVVMQSDLMEKDLYAAANGHRMNNCGVVTSSVHGDIAFTLGSYLYRKWFPKAKDVPMNISNLVVTKGLVANSNTKNPQLFRVTAEAADKNSGVVDLTWQNVDNSGEIQEPFATAQIIYGDKEEWLTSWEPLTHLVSNRIETLERLAVEGKASRFSRNMAYRLFGSNLVDYADKYRGMQSVVMHELEAFADVQLTTKEAGSFTVPPYFIDSVAHLAGFIMNCSDAMDTTNNYCVTPGWKSMRFAKPLTPGAKYRSYVKMIPTKEDPTVFLGDVYIMQDDVVIGMVGGIQFRQFPRILLTRFFNPPDKTAAADDKSKASAAPAPKPAAAETKPAPAESKPAPAKEEPLPMNKPDAEPGPPKTEKKAEAPAEASTESSGAAPAAEVANNDDSITAKALRLVAQEGGLELSDLQDDVGFADLGVDSLMSLVISEKFGSELGVKVSGSLFLDYPTIGDMRAWLDEYYS